MIKVMFVCHGNICRSPMAEYVFKKMIKDMKLEDNFIIESSATSSEEIGSDIHYGTKRILDKYNIPYQMREAKRFRKEWYDSFDYIILMDQNNKRNLYKIIENDPNHKVKMLLEYAGESRDIADPWYNGNFEKTYEDIVIGLNSFIKHIL